MSVNYVYTYQRDLMYATGTEVRRVEPRPSTNINGVPEPATQAAPLNPFGKGPLIDTLFGVPFTPQANALQTLQPTGLKRTGIDELQAKNPVQERLLALQPKEATEPAVTGPFATLDAEASKNFAINRGVAFVNPKTAAEATPKVQLIPPDLNNRVEVKTLFMPPAPQQSEASANANLFSLLARFNELFSNTIKDPMAGQGGGQGMYMGGGSTSGEGRGGEHHHRQPQGRRFSASA